MYLRSFLRRAQTRCARFFSGPARKMTRGRPPLELELLENRLVPSAGVDLHPPIDFQAVNDWGSGLEANVNIHNPRSADISAWKLEFDYGPGIDSIWNAGIASHVGNHYVVTHARWNATIDAGASLSFGFIAHPGGALGPSNYILSWGSSSGSDPAPLPPPADTVPPSEPNPPADPAPAPGGAVTFTVTSDWQSGFTAAIAVKNTAATGLTSWTLEFDFGHDITTIWNARIVSHEGAHYVIRNEDWNGTLAAGATVSFGFNGTPGDVRAVPAGYIFNGIPLAEPPVEPSPPSAPLPPSEPAPADPLVSIADAVVTEGNTGSAAATFVVSLSAASSTSVTVAYTAAADSAQAGSDFQASQGILTFAPGETQKTIAVPINGDTQVEPSENFLVLLSAASGARIEDGQAVGTIVNDDRPPVDGGSGPRVVGYFAEWSIYDRAYQVLDVPAWNLTHLNYAFANISPTGEVIPFDTWAAVDKSFPGDTWDQPFRGNYRQLLLLKEQYPHLQTLISVGGWTLSDKFSDVALTEQSRFHFAASAVDFIVTYGFDGIDLDWEYPVSGGLPSNTYRPSDKENYTLLAAEVRRQLDVRGTLDGRHYLLTIAAPAGFDKIANFELGPLAGCVDWFNVMTYDYHGTWENSTNHLAPLYASPNDPSALAAQYNIDWTIQAYLGAGVPADKIVMGIPLYTRAWQGVGSANNGLYQPASGSAPGTWEAGMYDYADLHDLLESQPDQYLLFWDEEAQVPYVYNPTLGGGMFSSYENQASVQAKLDYLSLYQLGGVFFWELDGDVRDPASLDSLVTLVARELLATS